MKQVAMVLLVLGCVCSFVSADILPDWQAIVIREANDGSGDLPVINLDPAGYSEPSAIEFINSKGGQKAGLATDLINGATIDLIDTLHIDRLDDIASSGSLYGPYFNIWVTDGNGNYAVLANEPSDAEWAGSRWDVPSWDFLKTKRCKVYETVGASGGNPGTSWVATHTGISTGLVFEDVADLIILPPPPAYIAAGNGVGSGAPDELGTNIAYGFTWVFGDTAANYVNGDGFVVAGYAATRNYPPIHNETQDLYYNEIQAAINAAVADDVIRIADGTYTVSTTININKSITLAGTSQAGTVLDIDTNAGYGLHPSVGGVTLSDMTLNVISSVGQYGGYVVHASGTPNVLAGLTVQNMTIQGSGTIDRRRAGLDIHGYDNVVITNVTSKDSTWGNGIQLTGCDNVQVSNVTTDNNAWGSLAVYCSQYLNPQRASSNVQIDAPSCTFNEGNVFVENQFGLTCTDIVVTGYEYRLRNTTFRSGAEGFIFYQPDLATAEAFAAVTFAGFEDATSFERIDTGHFEVYPGMTIQAAIDAADVGGTVEVAAGTYEEQLHITKNDLHLVGSGNGADPMADTIVLSPVDLTWFYHTSNDNYPIVGVDGATGVIIEALRVDGAGRGNSNYRFQGIGFWNSGGTILDCDIVNVLDTPFSGSQHGVGIYAYNNTGGPYTINVTNVSVTDYQKTGMALNGEGLTANVTGCTTVGAGPTDVTAQNGIQFWGSNGGTISNCSVTGNIYTGGGWAASGILMISSGSVELTNTTVENNDPSVYAQDTHLTASGITIEHDDPDAGNGFYVRGQSGVSALKASKSKLPAEKPAQPFGDFAETKNKGTRATISATLENSTLTGASGLGYGVSASNYYADDTINLSVTGCTVTDWQYGFVIFSSGGDVATTANNNNLAGNLFGFYSALPGQNAECNWWGSAVYEEIAEIISETVDFEPWLTSEGGTCDGTVDPPALRIDLADADNCYKPGETLTVNVMMGTTNHYVGGGQMFLTFDDATLELDTVTPGTDLRQVYYDDSVAGELVYGVGIEENGDPIDGTLGDTLLATLTFTVLVDADENCALADVVAFVANGVPPNATYLTTVPAGRLIPTELENAPEIMIDETAPVITAPANVTVDADPGECHAVLTSGWTHTFDEAPVIDPDAWFVDRYAPAVFTNELFDGDMRLKQGVSEADSESNRPGGYGSSFYNTQGYMYNFTTPTPWQVQVDLYIPAEWEGESRRAGLWAVVHDSEGERSGYPIVSYYEGEGFRCWDDLEPGGWVPMSFPGTFVRDAWYTLKFEAGWDTYKFTVEGPEGTSVTHLSDRGPDHLQYDSVILQVYNFGETYHVYWDNLILGPEGPVVTDECSIVSIAYERQDDAGLTLNDPFEVGTTDVVWTATDCAGNTASATQVITVEDNELPTITCPANIVVDAAPGVNGTDVTVPLPVTDDNCGVASVINDYNSTDDASDWYPIGTTTVVFTVTDVHGNTADCSFDVTVNPAPFVVLIDIEGDVVNDPVTRCIEFVFTDCSGVEETRSADVIFAPVADGYGYYWSGMATFTDLPVATYTKVSAQDGYHTLTRVVDAVIDGADWIADFTGTNKLIQGDLYDDTADWGVDFIDIVDFGVYASEWGWSGDPNTPCVFADLYHPDLDGDGAVDVSDYGFINRNFLESGDILCSKGLRNVPQPRRSITIAELEEMGLGHLRKVDLNRDGRLDGRDVKLYLTGGTPTPDPGSIGNTLEPVQVQGTMRTEAGIPAKAGTFNR